MHWIQGKKSHFYNNINDIWNQATQNTNTGSISKYTLSMHVIAYVRPLSLCMKSKIIQKMCTIAVEWTQALSTDWPLEKRFRSLDCICSGKVLVAHRNFARKLWSSLLVPPGPGKFQSYFSIQQNTSVMDIEHFLSHFTCYWLPCWPLDPLLPSITS